MDIGLNNIEQWGGEGSGFKGQKDDIRIETDKKGLKTLVDRIEQQRTPEDKLLAEAAKCAGEGVGISNLGKSGKVGIETKVVDSQGSRVKTGEGTFTRTTSTCETDEDGNPTGSNTTEKQFLVENAKRLDRCSGNKESNSLGKSESFKKACEYQQKSKKEYDRLNRLLEGTDKEFEEAIKIIERHGDPKTVGERIALARAYRRNRGTPSDQLSDQEKEQRKKEKEAFGKIQRELQDAILLDSLARDTSSDGTVSGDSADYLLYRLALEGGSLEEGIKDIRMLRNNQQHLGLLNEITYGAIAMVRSGQARIRKSGRGISIETIADQGEGDDSVPKGTSLLKGKIERGQFVAEVGVKSGRKSSNELEDNNESVDKFDLFKSLIDNQNKILFELFNQTKI